MNTCNTCKHYIPNDKYDGDEKASEFFAKCALVDIYCRQERKVGRECGNLGNKWEEK